MKELGGERRGGYVAGGTRRGCADAVNRRRPFGAAANHEVV